MTLMRVLGCAAIVFAVTLGMATDPAAAVSRGCQAEIWAKSVSENRRVTLVRFSARASRVRPNFARQRARDVATRCARRAYARANAGSLGRPVECAEDQRVQGYPATLSLQRAAKARFCNYQRFTTVYFYLDTRGGPGCGSSKSSLGASARTIRLGGLVQTRCGDN